MKKSCPTKFLCIVLFCVGLSVFGQSKSNTAQKYTIELTPKEIGPSGLLSLIFEDEAIITYKILHEEVVVQTSEVTKPRGNYATKIDLSTLSPNDYLVVFYIEERQVSEIAFKKI
tara:strand:+ start:1265 stop:1609 length:345 start_codon:yes stop_codon:yes gene_type:complete